MIAAAMSTRPIPGRRPRRRHSSGQADIGTIIVLACLCVAVFGGCFLLGRAASPQAPAGEPALASLAPSAAAVPVRMSPAPPIAIALVAGPHRRPARASHRLLAGAVTPDPATVREAFAVVPIRSAKHPPAAHVRGPVSARRGHRGAQSTGTPPSPSPEPSVAPDEPSG